MAIGASASLTASGIYCKRSGTPLTTTRNLERRHLLQALSNPDNYYTEPWAPASLPGASASLTASGIYSKRSATPITTIRNLERRHPCRITISPI